MASSCSKEVTVIGVKDVDRCIKLTTTWLESGKALAIDAEGIALGAKGRLTLLQIGTEEGEVTLFDVINPNDHDDVEAAKQLFVKGGIKDILESSKVLKITHGCHADSGALFHQFGVRLQHVFDTQAAYLALEHATGNRFPRMQKLEVLCQKYTDIEHGSKSFKDEWLKDRLKFWARRPLSQDAIDYAAEDVKVLHKLHEAMKKNLHELKSSNSLTWYNRCAELIINEQVDPQMTTQKANALKKERMEEVFDEVKKKSSSNSNISEDERGSIVAFVNLCGSGIVKANTFPPHMKTIESRLIQQLQNEEQEYQNGIKTDFEQIDWLSISTLSNHPSEAISNEIKGLARRLRILRAKCDTKMLQSRIDEGKVISLDDITMTDWEALRRFREFRTDIKGCGLETIELSRLELEMSRKDMKDWEELHNKGQLADIASSQIRGTLRSLTHHQDPAIQAKAKTLNRSLTITKTIEEMSAMVEKYTGKTYRWSDLSANEQWTINNFRIHRSSFGTPHRIILELEHEMNHTDLSKYEQWSKAGQLAMKAGGKDLAIIKNLMAHSDPTVKGRAIALDNAFQQQRAAVPAV